MRQPLFVGLVSVVFLVQSASTQPKTCSWPELNPTPRNLDFSQGKVGSAPVGWLLGPEWFNPTREPAHEALVVGADQCHGSAQCATVRSLRSVSANSVAFLYQDLDASPYRGQTLVYRTFVRVDPHLGNVARLLVRVHRKDCSTTFRDDMGDHPIVSGEWAAYEIRAPIAADAYHIEFGVQLIGAGTLWIDQSSVESKPAPKN